MYLCCVIAHPTRPLIHKRNGTRTFHHIGNIERDCPDGWQAGWLADRMNVHAIRDRSIHE